MRDYDERNLSFSLWRENQQEIDFLVEKAGRPALGIECNAGRADLEDAPVAAFRRQFPKVPIVVASATDTRPRRRWDGIEILP